MENDNAVEANARYVTVQIVDPQSNTGIQQGDLIQIDTWQREGTTGKSIYSQSGSYLGKLLTQ